MIKARWAIYLLAEQKREREAIKAALAHGNGEVLTDAEIITRATSNTVDRGVMRSPNAQRNPDRELIVTGDRAPPSNHRASMIR
jgi:hypothetical protein